MEKIVWKERFSVGVPALDEQHKRLIDLINNLRDSDRKGIALETVTGMIEYASVHFKAEEALLRQAGYSELPTQQREHKAFIDQAEAVSKKDLNDPRTATELVRYLHAWLLHHILEEDMKFKRCIPEHLRRR